MREIGVMGGSFNPIHLGHLLTAQCVAERCGLERVYLVPSSTSPFKQRDPEMASAADRLAMVRLAVEGAERLACSAVEVGRGGVSYAIDTVRYFQERFPVARISFIIGMDGLGELYRWQDAVEFVKLCRVLSVKRPGFRVPYKADELGFDFDTGRQLLAQVVEGRSCEISASEVRRRIAEKRSIRYLVTSAVEAYIREHGVYANF